MSMIKQIDTQTYKAKLRFINQFMLRKVVENEKDSSLTISDEKSDLDLYTNSFPIVIGSTGEVATLVNLYFINYLKENEDIRGSNLKSLAVDLLDYVRFLEAENLDIFDFPEKIYQRVTYKYNKNLRYRIENQLLSVNTAKQRMARVVNFYEFIFIKGLRSKGDFINQPYEIYFKRIHVKNDLGFDFEKTIKSSSLAIKGSKSVQLADYIYDDGPLRPLLKFEQELLSTYLIKKGTIQLKLICYMAYHTGARLQSICTFRVRDVNELFRQVDGKQKKGTIRIGYGTGIDSKKGQQYGLEVPGWLVVSLKNYIDSEAWKERADKSFYGSSDENYVFLTNKGVPFYTSKNELAAIKKLMVYGVGRKTIKTYSGGAVRTLFDNLIKTIQADHPEFEKVRFHDLRATFGMNLIVKLNEQKLNNQQSLDYVKKRMGHKNIKVTMGYLDYHGVLSNKVKIQDLFEDNLMMFVSPLK